MNFFTLAALSWEPVLDALSAGGMGLAHVSIWLLCLAGLLLSALSISGTWLVLLAGVIAAFITPAAYPGWGLVLAFLLVSVLVEVVETFAGSYGVTRRGGSGWAGFAALVGGLLGLFVGSALLPVIGSLLGMFAGSFALAYWVEKYRLQHTGKAVHVATGAVLARIAMIFIKGIVTAAMSLVLLMGLY